jgi:DNA-binding NarL/FixJ family response regulator
MVLEVMKKRASDSHNHPGADLLSTEDWGRVGARFRLTRRELAVVRLLFVGQTRSQIARELSCAPATIRVYIDRLFTKLAVTDRLGLALRIVQAHFIHPT